MSCPYHHHNGDKVNTDHRIKFTKLDYRHFDEFAETRWMLAKPSPSPLKTARLAKGLSMAALGKLAGTSAQQVERLEKGGASKDGRKLTKEWALRLAPFLGVTAEFLIFGEIMVRLAGYANAGASVHLFSTGDIPDEMVRSYDGAPPETVAIELRGGCMGDVFDGWLAYYDRISSGVTSDMIGQLCIVWLEDGRVLAKKIAQGQIEGRYTLISNFEPPIYDAAVTYAARVRNLQPRSR